MDYIIISTNRPDQQAYWQQKLEKSLPQFLKREVVIISTYEDWNAGNGFGSLYAYQRAQAQAKVDLDQELRKGASIAIYHTAGKGKRLAPLVSSEHSAKGAVLLPFKNGTISLLEAVILQTSSYAQSRKGRLSVFWGDQLFIPSTGYNYTPQHHIDILAKMGLACDLQSWRQHQMDRYGLIVDNSLLNKISFEQFQTLAPSATSIGTSLGSFSLSHTMLSLLLKEFEGELKNQLGQMDSDPHFWMAMTLPKKTYTELGYSKEHWERMQQLTPSNTSLKLFGAVDIGLNARWWDFGSTQLYHQNLLNLSTDEELRHFLQVPSFEDNLIINSDVGKGEIKGSVIINTEATELNVSDCVIIESDFFTLNAKESLFYRVSEKEPLTCPKATVKAGLLDKTILTTTLQNDGKDDWQKRLPGNLLSYAEVYAQKSTS